jgi:hypothetical protein
VQQINTVNPLHSRARKCPGQAGKNER